ncbi:monooxygenase [Xylanimonas oleitrophica]|uniref:Monooxygenase n=1 Tax=Xylanimonas oleitrophica TaxID=2607479 RepID=A0A2W5YJ59_9MICO|nr:NAD(P)/FAD-dependent oxidoreductase [Xylanimonas oleitrophica]PZR55201.1 monooxygenase [Xylanimonas oleitrophica]
MSRADADVLVVGGGPVGLAAAIGAREAGLDVLVLERREGTLDKACGEGLLPGALAAVRELGVDPPGHPISGISYRRPGAHADHLFTAGEGRGVRRTRLHEALRERAEHAGAVLLHASVHDLRQDAAGVEVETGPARLRGRWLLGCDGLHSTVRRLAGLDAGSRARPAGRAAATRPDARARYGLRRHYRVRPWNDLVEVHWSDRAEAYVTPVAPDVVGVAVLGPRHATAGGSFEEALAAGFPELADRLAGAEPLGAVRGAGPLRQRTTRRTAGRVRLVGDASGYVDALTGEGVRVGLAQARAAVRHLDDADAYERAWRAATRDYRLLTSGLVAWATGPARRAIVPAARALPPLYGAVVERLAR